MRTYRSRRLALQALCCLDAQGNTVWNLVDEFIADADEPPDVIQAARKLTTDTFDRRDECDAILARHARHWDLSRLAMVDRNILRQGVFELLEGRTPPKAVITEALHLAREFSTAESPRFVNGVLDAVARELRAETAGPPDG
ncbi:MAG: transcription antitermination factor NusB [Phycisphaerae bacterium]